MKIGDVELKRYEGTYQLMRENEAGKMTVLDISIHSLPYSWDIEAMSQIPKPEATKTGKLIVVEGEQVPERDDSSPEYMHLIAEWERVRQAKRIYDGTNEGAITWTTDKATLESSPKKFYENIATELDGVLGAGEVMHWSNCIVGISQVGGYDVALAEERMFLVAARAENVQEPEQIETQPVDGHVLDEVSRTSDVPEVGEVAV